MQKDCLRTRTKRGPWIPKAVLKQNGHMVKVVGLVIWQDAASLVLSGTEQSLRSTCESGGDSGDPW